jgi:Subtilase family
MRLKLHATLVLAAAAILVLGAGVASAGTTRAAARPVPTPRAYSQSHAAFATLPQAVAAGRLQRSVLRTLEHRGSVDAIVTVDFSAANAPVQPQRGRSLSSAGRFALRARIGAMRRVFGREEHRALANTGDVEVLRSWPNLPSTLVRIRSTQALLAILNKADVVSVAADEHFESNGDAALPYINQPYAQTSGYTGAGTYVAVLDSGIDYVKYPDWGYCPSAGVSTCKIVDLRTFAYDPYDNVLDDPTHAHGSNVASIVTQVAPGAKILGYDVFTGSGDSAGASFSNIADALNDLVTRQAAYSTIVAANMSIGSGAYDNSADCTTYAGSKITGAFTSLRNVGILPVVSSGNGAGGGSVYGIAAPACVSNALSVGATYYADLGYQNLTTMFKPGCIDSTTWAEKIACFSQSGSALDMLAPGTWINGGSGSWIGTSQAAPHVAGAAAVLASSRWMAADSSRADAIESALKNNGPLLTDNRFSGHSIALHRLDLKSALAGFAPDRTAPAPPTVSRRFTLYGVADPVAKTVPVTFTWSASDPSGIASYDVFIRSSSDPSTISQAQWYNANLAATATSVNYALTSGKSWQLAVRATDGAGNQSDWSYSNATVGISDDASWSNTSISPWIRLSWSPSYGGTEIYSKTAGNNLLYSLMGTDVAWIAPKYSGAGVASVSWDGKSDGTVNLGSSTTQPRLLVYTVHYGDVAASHNVKVGVSSGQVDIDAFATLK